MCNKADFDSDELGKTFRGSDRAIRLKEWRIFPALSLLLSLSLFFFIRMRYADYIQQYSTLEICNLTPDTPCDDNLGCWNTSYFGGMWKVGTTAGGCLKFPGDLRIWFVVVVKKYLFLFKRRDEVRIKTG